jgi:hypothetical protein
VTEEAVLGLELFLCFNISIPAALPVSEPSESIDGVYEEDGAGDVPGLRAFSL